MNIIKRIKETVKTLTTRDIFLSYRIKHYLEEKMKAVHKHFKIPDVELSIIYDENNGDIAYTNNRSYTINAGHPFFYGARELHLSKVCGVLLHEIGHRVFTSFTTNDSYIDALTHGELLYAPAKNKLSEEEASALDEIKLFISADPLNGMVFGKILHELKNILEDGRIEYILLNSCEQFYTCYDGLEAAREQSWQDALSYQELLKQTKDGNIKEFRAIMSLILHYVRFGEIKGFDYEKDEKGKIFNTFTNATKHTDDYLNSFSAITGLLHLNFLIISLWDSLKEFLKEMIDETQEQRKSPGKKVPDYSGGGSIPDTSPLTSSEMEALSEAVVKAISEIEGSMPSVKSSMTGKEVSSEIIEELSKLLGTLPGEEESAKIGSPARPKYERTEKIRSFGTGKIFHTEELGVVIKQAETTISEELVTAEEEAKRTEDIERLRKTIDFGECHENTDCIFKHIKITEELKNDYLYISGPLKEIAKKMAKKSDFFSDDESPIMMRNKYYGTRFNQASIARKDFKNFSRKVFLEESPTIAVAVLVDESGSMSGIKADIAKKTAITLWEYCHLMNVPCSIFGHSETFSSGIVEIMPYADFDCPSENDKYRLSAITARDNNRDGYALRLLKKKLEDFDANTKLLIVISDGAPAATNYSGAAAFADLKDIAKSCEKEDIILLAAAIDSDKEAIKRAYGESHFLDITDIEMLPTTITNLIKRLLK